MLARKRMAMRIDRRRLDPPRAVAALERFLELTAADRRERATRPIVEATRADVEGVLKAQSVEFRKGLVGLKAKFGDPDGLGPVWPGDWIPYFDQAASLTRAEMVAGLYDNILEALWTGGGHLVEDVGAPLTIGFNVENPRAVGWAIHHAAGEVTKINAATREGINRVIVEAVENGYSYTRTAEKLAKLYEFSAGRAKRIAVYEIGTAYEQGKKMAAGEMAAQGLKMEKKWQSAGDARVRPAHRENQGAGWIGMDEAFPSGDDLAPSDPGCRCVGLWRVAK